MLLKSHTLWFLGALLSFSNAAQALVNIHARRLQAPDIYDRSASVAIMARDPSVPSVSKFERSGVLGGSHPQHNERLQKRNMDVNGNGISFPVSGIPLLPGSYNVRFVTGQVWNWGTIYIDLYSNQVSVFLKFTLHNNQSFEGLRHNKC
jgi:hypothetical protein